MYHRYSNPLTLLDSLIENGMLSDYINTLNEKAVFDFEFDVWLHKVADMSFDDWRKQIHSNVEARTVEMDETEIKTTVLKSSNILNGFEPQ